jgi:hypothetical protein
MQKGIKTESMLEVQKDIDNAQERMRNIFNSDRGIKLIVDNGKVERLDLTMDKTLFDMYWNIREKAYKKLEELAKQ